MDKNKHALHDKTRNDIGSFFYKTLAIFHKFPTVLVMVVPTWRERRHMDAHTCLGAAGMDESG